MSKHLTTGRIARYLICLALACVAVLGVTYARYYQEVQGQGSASVATVALGLGSGTGALDLTPQLQGMYPGDSCTVKFAVKNAQDGAVSEVALEYSIAIETTGNLPLTYTLVAKSGANDSKGYATTPSESSSLTWTGGELPYGPADAGTSHLYELTVAWPDDERDEALADEIDLVTLTVDAQQAAPKTL